MTASGGGFRWLTPADPAAISIVRVAALPALLDRPLPEIDRARLACLRSPDGAAVDEVVAARIAVDALELMCHGGPGVRTAVTACLRAHGLEHDDAPTGDPRWRALARAPSPAAARWLLRHGDAAPPFPRAFLERLPTVLIAGPPNAGKSTLLNAWCGHARALVSDLPGTTRDLVAAVAPAGGWRLRLLDSAGLRPPGDALEAAGQALTRAARAGADLVLVLDPVDAAPGEVAAPHDLVVASRIDLAPPVRPHDARWTARGVAEATPAELLADLCQLVLARLGLPAMD